MRVTLSWRDIIQLVFLWCALFMVKFWIGGLEKQLDQQREVITLLASFHDYSELE